ncbi:MAG: GGDEF domain-containing protein [Thermoleophilaceae bacterium]|nr:GGDEF domain-containing protein [Thermoleophilaceae bacterium]
MLGLVLLASGPWVGWWTIVPLVLAAGLFRLADASLERCEYPEYTMFAAWFGSQIIIAVSVALTGGATAATLSWLAIPVVTLSARFSLRGIVIGVAGTLVLLLAVAFGVNAQEVLHDPPLVLAPGGLIVAIAMLSTALMRSDVEHRTEAVIDPLTGMLNRKALASRVPELSQQAAVSGQPIGVIVGDLDRFKQINDLHGHLAGDAVLTDVADLLRNSLRAFDLVYRLGGEEFLVLLPGSGPEQTRALAERLREAIESTPLRGGHRVTMSFGVSGSRAGEPFDYETELALADAALYEAKRAGRNAVRAAERDSVPASA